MQNKKLFDYDPMLYDVMRESATRLGGEFIDLANHACMAAEREAFLAADQGVQREAQQVDIYDADAVKIKTGEFAARLEAIEAAAMHKPEILT